MTEAQATEIIRLLHDIGQGIGILVALSFEPMLENVILAAERLAAWHGYNWREVPAL